MKKTNKLLAILLCLAMFISLLPTWALAEDAVPVEEPAAALMQEAVQEESEAELPEQTFTTDSRIVTLSTCTNDAGSRFVVQGVRTAALAPEGGSAGSDRAEEKKESGEEADPYEQFVEKNG